MDGFAYLRRAARHGPRQIGVHRLDGINHQNGGMQTLNVADDPPDVRFEQKKELVRVNLQPIRAEFQLLNRFLTRHVERGEIDVSEELQDERRFPGPRRSD